MAICCFNRERAMDKTTNIIVVVFLAAIFLLGWSVASAAIPPPLDRSAASAARAFTSELPDKCKTPAGYTDEQWRQHMGHHPDRYAECLT